MAVSFRDVGADPNQFTSSVTSQAFTIPATAKPGDFLVLGLSCRAIVTSPSATAGWTQRTFLNSQSPSILVYTKVCAPGDPGSNVTVSWTTSCLVGGAVCAYTGVDSTTPIDASASATAGTGFTVGYGNVTSPLNDTLVAIGDNANGGTINGATAGSLSFTKRVGSSGGLCISDAASTAGSNGAVSSTAGNNGANTGAVFALRPAQVPALRDTTAVINQASGVNIPTPSTQKIGDMQVAVAILTATGTITTPAGWTKQIAETTWNTSWVLAVYTKVATTAGAENVTWSFTGAGTISVDHTLYSGVGSVDVVGATATGTTTVTAPAVTTTSADDRLLAVGGQATAGNASAAGMTLDSQASITTFVLSESNQAAGATGTRAVTVNGAGVAALLALKPSTGQPKVRGVAQNTRQSSQTSRTITLPPNLATGDYVIATIQWTDATSPGTVTDPAGWTVIESDLTGTNNVYFKAYAKTAGASEANPSVTWVTSTGVESSSLAIVGSATLDIDGHTGTAGSTSVTFPSVTTTTLGDLLLFFNASGNTSGTPTNPTGTVALTGIAPVLAASIGMSYEVAASAAATGSRTATVGGSAANNVGYVVALAGASAAGNPIVMVI